MSDYNFIAGLAKRIGTTQIETKKFLEGVKEELSSAVKKGETIRLTDFGTFKLQEYKERKIKNIHTGQPMVVPARKGMSFTMSSKLKEVING